MFAGVDTHKDNLAVAVIDAGGRVQASCSVANTEEGFSRLSRVISQHKVHRIGIEGSGGYGRAAAVHLALIASLEVVEVPTTLTSRERNGRPGKGKTDPGDAVAIARITARETNLPPVRPAVGAAADLRAVVDYRDQLVAERQQLINRVHADLVGLRPGYQREIHRLNRRWQLLAAGELLAGDDSVRAGIARRRLHRLEDLDTELAAIRKEIATAVDANGTRLRELYGLGDVVAARIIAEVVDVRRYPSRHAFAAANGSAPLPASSGRTVRHRLNRGGNRRLNRCLFTIALTQIRADTEGRVYYLRKRTEGKTKREALRCLKRRLSDIVYRTLLQDAYMHNRKTTATPLAA